MTTKKGYALADKLGAHVGWTNGITETCSKLTRAASSYSTIQERWCCEEMTDERTAQLEKRETALEALIGSLVQDLPHTDDGPFVVQFSGDPRGHTVRLVAPDGREIGVDQ